MVEGKGGFVTLHDSLYYATPEDIAFFEQATAGLPKRLPDEPYHCGPQNVAAFRYAVLEASKCSDEIHDTRSVSVVEIGFNLGHSAACFLALGAHVWSIDIRLDQRVKSSIKSLERYGADFGFMFREFEWLYSVRTPDLAFIDGGHDYSDVKEDIELCRHHNITRFLFDDWYPHHGPGVQQAVFDSGLLPLAVIGSMAYCEEPSTRGFVKQPEIV
jgi:hypothetical protein